MNNRIGIIIPLVNKPQLLQTAQDFGVKQVELNCWNPDTYSPELAEALKTEASQLDVNITALWAGWPGPTVWDFIQGPTTLGLVPPVFRARRISALKKGAD